MSRSWSLQTDSWGGADLLVNNAGIYPRIDFLEMTEDDWDEVLSTNLKGAFLCTRAAAKGMVKHGRGGTVLNISSVAGVNRASAGRPLLGKQSGSCWTHAGERVGFSSAWYSCQCNRAGSRRYGTTSPGHERC